MAYLGKFNLSDLKPQTSPASHNNNVALNCCNSDNISIHYFITDSEHRQKDFLVWVWWWAWFIMA
jgi:hypothetical protein